jgi:hypothetical protein
MPEYEIQVAGPIGPVVASSLPGFTFLKVPAGTILAGTVARPDDLLSVINLLNGHGLALTDVWISHGDHADFVSHRRDSGVSSIDGS